MTSTPSDREHRDHRRYDAYARYHDEHGATELIPAATVIVLRDTPDGLETLMLHKNSKIAFGGMWVFPGGRIDDADEVLDEDGNEVEKEVVTTTTNTPFAGMSDSGNQVAAFSSRGNVGIGIEGPFGRFKPDLVAPGTFIISTRSADWKNSITSTNAQADADALEKQNDELGDQYRYESGTSVAAPAISGMLALMQEFYTGRLKRTNSPALMKALLINSAQSVDARYNHNVRSTVNHQGWGLPNLGRAVPALAWDLAGDKPTDEKTWPMQFIDQSLANALATGESRSWEITLGSNALHYPIRFTLAWTDPPGNPNAAVKLVNDLDLMATGKPCRIEDRGW